MFQVKSYSKGGFSVTALLILISGTWSLKSRNIIISLHRKMSFCATKEIYHALKKGQKTVRGTQTLRGTVFWRQS